MPMSKKLPYTPALILFSLFFIYILLGEKTNIYQARKYDSHSAVANVVMSDTPDEDTPLGFKTTYKFQIDSLDETENSLAFYLVHQYTEVYFDDTLVYSITPSEDSKIGKSPASNWVIIPLYAEDVGKDVRIEVIPVYKDFSHRQITILQGCHFDIFVDCLLDDLPELILASMCTALGICILIVHFVNRKYKYWNILYLGMMSFLIGIWKLADLPLSPMLLPEIGKGIGYVALESLLLLGTTILLYAKQIFLHVKTKSLDRITVVNYIAAVSILLLQVFNIFDLRELLFLTHLGLIIIVITITYTTIKNLDYIKKSSHSGLYRFFVIALILSLFGDLILYYVTPDGLNMIFTLFMFFIYCATAFILHVLQTTRKVYTDTMTGLFNKVRWNEAVAENLASSDVTAIIMLDLNTLKKVNDLYGHDVGDRMIFRFASILKKVLPHECLICRWGGDEFAVMLNNVTHEHIHRYLKEIETEVLKNNQSDEQAQISYATGYAISSDYKEISSDELFRKADENMYLMKQEYYRKNK